MLLRLSLTLLSLLTIATVHASEKQRVPKGTYYAISGWVETLEISVPGSLSGPEQLGRFSVMLYNGDWQNLTKDEKKSTPYFLNLNGSLRGKVNPENFTASHVMIDDNRNYSIHTAGDILMPTAGDPFCSTGVPMEVSEQVNIVGASGKYQNLTSGTLYFTGTVNNCAGQPNYGKNNLQIVPLQGTVTFE